MENETAAVEWKSYTRLRATYHFPLIRISGTTIRNPAMFRACTVKYSEEVWLGVNQTWQPTRPSNPFLEPDALLPRGIHPLETPVQPANEI